MSSQFVAEDVVKPEGDEHAEGGKGENGVNVFATNYEHDAQSDEGNAREPGGKAVDAVNEVDGIYDVYDEEQGEWHAYPSWDEVDAEDAGEGVESVAAEYEEECCGYLCCKLAAVPYADEVVHDADEVEQYAADGEEEELEEGFSLGEVDEWEAEVVSKAHRQAEGDENYGDEGDAAEAWHGGGVDFAKVGHVEQTLLVGNQEDVGDDHHSQ